MAEELAVEPGRETVALYEPRAATLLEAAQQRLQTQAAKIEDNDQRRSFLENIPAHREIMGED
jgi:hypothetical protein